MEVLLLLDHNLQLVGDLEEQKTLEMEVQVDREELLLFLVEVLEVDSQDKVIQVDQVAEVVKMDQVDQVAEEQLFLIQ